MKSTYRFLAHLPAVDQLRVTLDLLSNFVCQFTPADLHFPLYAASPTWLNGYWSSGRRYTSNLTAARRGVKVAASRQSTCWLREKQPEADWHSGSPTTGLRLVAAPVLQWPLSSLDSWIQLRFDHGIWRQTSWTAVESKSNSSCKHRLFMTFTTDAVKW